jgi:hypothetical protein
MHEAVAASECPELVSAALFSMYSIQVCGSASLIGSSA